MWGGGGENGHLMLFRIIIIIFKSLKENENWTDKLEKKCHLVKKKNQMFQG